MVRVKMKRSETGCLASDPGLVKKFAKGGIYEVDTDLAEAFVHHMDAAEETDEDLFDPLALPSEPVRALDSENGTPTYVAPSVVDLAAMAASVADMLEAKFKANLDATSERLALIEVTIAELEKGVRSGVSGSEFDLNISEIRRDLKNIAEGLAKTNAAHTTLRAEFDAALDDDTPPGEGGDTAAPKPAKPKGTK